MIFRSNMFNKIIVFLVVLNAFCSHLPKKIIHFGQQKYLLEDRKHNTIPNFAWNNFIMGNKNNWNLPKVRRGLYGAGFNASSFAPACKEKKKAWFMVIRIHPKCKKQELSADLRDIPKNKEFIDWYKNSKLPHKYFENMDEFLISCYGYDPKNSSKQKPRKPMIRYHKEYELPEDYGIKNNYLIHEKILNSYLVETNKVLVKDDIFAENSWYIRDRKCILAIKALPSEILYEIKTNPTFWNYVEGEKEEEMSPMFSILLRALSTTQILNLDFLDEFIDSIPGQGSYLKLSSLKSIFAVFMEYYREKKQFSKRSRYKEHISGYSTFDIQIYVDILRDMRVCIKKNKTKNLQKKIQNILKVYDKDCTYKLKDVRDNIQSVCL